MPFSMAEVINDPDFAQAFTIMRSAGAFSLGKWINQTSNVPGYGIIQPSTAEELEQVPEADRVKGAITIHSSQTLNETDVQSNSAAISDTVTWNNQTYRVVKVWPWQDFGYFKAVLVRMSGK